MGSGSACYVDAAIILRRKTTGPLFLAGRLTVLSVGMSEVVLGEPMAQECRSGHIIPESGVYRVTHASGHAGAQLQVRLIKGRRFPGCPYCQEISFELAHSDEAFWRNRSAPGTRYRRHRRSALRQSSNKAVVGRSRAVARLQLQGLTGLRGVGAIWVVIYHAQLGLDLPVANAGYLGVDLFFILSGFILSHAHPETRWAWSSYRSFLRARFARLFPMHWAGLTLIGLVLFMYPQIYYDMPDKFRWPDLVSSILLMQNWGWGGLTPWNIPAWSLSTEWLVSILFPLFLMSARRVSRPISAAVFCAICLAGFLVFLAVTHNPTPNVTAKAGIVRTVCEFSAGCLLYRVYSAGVSARTGALLSAGAALIFAGIMAPALAVLWIFSFPLMILLAAQSSNPLSAILSSRWLVFLGEISYSIYLLHWILLQASNRLETAWNVHNAGALLWFFGFLAVVIALSAVTYHSIEIPARRALRDRRVPRQALATANVSANATPLIAATSSPV